MLFILVYRYVLNFAPNSLNMAISTHIVFVVFVANMVLTTAMSSGDKELCGIVFERHDGESSLSTCNVGSNV